MTVNSCNVPVGRSVYTPLLTADGGFRSDLTIMRLGENHFRVVTGAFDGGRDKYWFTRNLPTDGSVTFTDRTSGICTIGVWGPKAQATMAKIVTGQHKPYDVTQAGFPYGVGARRADRRRAVHDVPHLVRRRERLGDLHQDRARAPRVGHDLGSRRRSSTSVRSGSASTP